MPSTGETVLVLGAAAGRLRPEISRIFPLEEIGAALRHLADRQGIGKVIVDVQAARP